MARGDQLRQFDEYWRYVVEIYLITKCFFFYKRLSNLLNFLHVGKSGANAKASTPEAQAAYEGFRAHVGAMIRLGLVPLNAAKGKKEAAYLQNLCEFFYCV